MHFTINKAYILFVFMIYRRKYLLIGSEYYMVKLLVSSNNLHFLKNINNYIYQYRKSHNIILTNMSTNYGEMLANINNFKPKIIIIDLNTLKTDISEILKNIIEIQYFSPHFIVIDKCTDKTSYVVNYKNIKIINSEKNVYNDIIKEVLRVSEKIISLDSNNLIIRNRIINEIKKIGFEVTNKGVIYIIESIIQIKNLRYTSDNLEGDIYPIISKKFNVSEKSIKWNIIYSINNMYKRNDISKLKNYFGFSNNRKPTSKLVILTIVNRTK